MRTPRSLGAAAAMLVAAACAGPGGGPSGAAAPPVASPAELVGLTEAEVERRLGAPGFVRRDAGAQIWQYGGEACLLDLFLYRDAGAYAVRHAELRRRENQTLADSACLADALSRKS